MVEDTINSMPEIIIDTLGGSKGTAEVSEYAEVGKVVAYFSVRDPDSGENGETSCSLNNKEFGLVKLEDTGKYKVSERIQAHTHTHSHAGKFSYLLKGNQSLGFFEISASQNGWTTAFLPSRSL